MNALNAVKALPLLSVLPGLLWLLPLPADARTSTFVCDYARYSHPESSHQAEEHFSFTFVLDEARNTAYVLGNPGSHPVTEHEGMRRFSFAEVNAAGEVMRTTVVASATRAAPGALAATQHDVAPMPTLIHTRTPPATTQPTLRLDGRCSAVGGR